MAGTNHPSDDRRIPLLRFRLVATVFCRGDLEEKAVLEESRPGSRLVIQRSRRARAAGTDDILVVNHPDVSEHRHASVVRTTNGWQLEVHGGDSGKSTMIVCFASGESDELGPGDSRSIGDGDVLIPNWSNQVYIALNRFLGNRTTYDPSNKLFSIDRRVVSWGDDLQVHWLLRTLHQAPPGAFTAWPDLYGHYVSDSETQGGANRALAESDKVWKFVALDAVLSSCEWQLLGRSDQTRWVRAVKQILEDLHQDLREFENLDGFNPNIPPQEMLTILQKDVLKVLVTRAFDSFKHAIQLIRQQYGQRGGRGPLSSIRKLAEKSVWLDLPWGLRPVRVTHYRLESD